MAVIESYNDNSFLFDGLRYPSDYVAYASGSVHVVLRNAAGDSKFVPLGSSVNGAVPTTQAGLITALSSGPLSRLGDLNRSRLDTIVSSAGVSLLAAIGDSITAASSQTAATYAHYGSRGFLTWAQVLSMGRLWMPLVVTAGVAAPVVNYNRAVSGQTTVHGLNVQLPEVLALNPRPSYCSVLMGTNDLALLPDDSAETIFGRLSSICRGLINVGIVPILVTVLPRGDGTTTGWSPLNGGQVTTAQQKLLALNRMIRQSPTSVDPRVIVVDPWARVADYATGGILTTMAADSIHPINTGAFEIGQEFATALSTTLRPVGTSPQSDLDVSPVLVSSAWGANAGSVGAGLTGTVPTGWTANRFAGAGTATVALTNRQTIFTVNAASDGSQYRLYKGTGTFASNEAVGAGVYGQADIDFAPGGSALTNPSRADITVRASAVVTHEVMGMGMGLGYSEPFPKAFVGRIRTPVVLAVAGGHGWQGWTIDRANNGSSHVTKWSNVMFARYESLATVGEL